jgi:hypothetical protein
MGLPFYRPKKIGSELHIILEYLEFSKLGALDGKHVTIIVPLNSGYLYLNYRNTFSIVLLALVDDLYNFTAADIGSYGKDSDGGISAKSNLGKALENKTINVPEDVELPGTNEKLPYVMAGDEAFPLKPYLLRPYPAYKIGGYESKKSFNYKQTGKVFSSLNANDTVFVVSCR